MWYKLIHNILIIELQPTFFRKKIINDYLTVLTAPITSLYNKWTQFRLSNIYKIEHTGQVCYLRKVLNDRFDQTQRRIYIGNGAKYKRDYIYTPAEQKPKHLGTMYLHQASDYADTGVDFIVYVPSELLDENNYELIALVNYYKEGVKRFKIESI